MRAARRARWAVFVAVVVTATLGASSAAMAAFRSTASASHSVTTATLQPPTNPAAAPGTCALLSDSVVVTWTKTASSWAAGYEVLSSQTSGGPYTVAATVTGRDTERATLSGLSLSTTYYLVVRATKGQWRSANTAQLAHTTRTLCL